MKTFLVGGAVRDRLLNLPVTDRDWVVVGATPEQLLSEGYQAVGQDFPVFLHPETREEYALARTERKTGKGYTGFICHSSPDITLEQDLQRRDLTINAIAMDENGAYIDPFRGQEDIAQRLLRHVSDAFSEDPLRVLRVARFAARYAPLGFRIAPETLTLMKQMVLQGELNELTAERVWKETEKALLCQEPQVYFETLRECGALQILFPEIDALFGVPAPEKWHPEIDSGLHTLLTLQQAARLTDDIEVRFCAFCHDVGKGLTPKYQWPHHPGHGQAGVPLVNALCLRLKTPTSLRELAELVSLYHDQIHIAETMSAESLLSLFNAIDVWRKPERLQQLLLASEADYRGRTGWEQRAYPQADYVHNAYQTAAEVDVKTIVSAGFSGKAIRDELNRQRIMAVSKWQQSNSF